MYELNERQRRFRDELRDFYSKNVESDWRHQTESWDDLGAYLRRWDSVLYEGGWSVPTWPEEYGGRGADAVERAIFAEETARFDAPEGLGRLGKRLVAPILMEYGSPEQKAMLEPVRRGEVVWCQGFSEPDAGSDLANIRVRAVSDGSDWVVNGTKVWTSFAQFAQWIFLLVRTGPADSREQGISILLVPLDSEGISTRPLTTLSGRDEFNEVHFDNVRVPQTAMVGERGGGWPIIRAVLGHERGAEYCLARFADLRRSFTELSEFVGGSARPDHLDSLGQHYARLYAIQVLASDLLSRESEGRRVDGLESVLKLYTTEAWRELGDTCVQQWGAPYFAEAEGALEDYFESRHYTISAGTSQIQRNMIAARILRMPSARTRLAS